MVVIDKPCFSIPQICESGQCFRLDPVAADIYVLQAADRYLKIQVGSAAAEIIEGESGRPSKNSSKATGTVLECSEEEYRKVWKDYFDLDASYDAFFERIAPEDVYLKRAAAFGSGIRILRQDVWEMIITFILSQQNNIPRIKKMIRELSCAYGEKKKAADGTEYYAFPTPEQLACAPEEKLRKMKFGYRSRYLCETAVMAVQGKVNLKSISGMEYREAREELMKFPGIGGKVADCICLFALHHLDAFPVDTHIRSVLDSHYNGKFPFEKYKGCAGVMQQYIFYFDLKGDA